MKTLETSNSIIANYSPSSYFSSSSSSSSLKERLLSRGPEFISYRRPWKLANSGLQHFVPLRRGGIDFISCFSSYQQVADINQSDALENQETDQSKTVRVKFQLQKECTFGEHFFVVGDDPIFGSWDVTSAIPLNWADGHQWAAEVDIPVGKIIQFKFILQGITGNVEWQPGPDRTFQPWETSNTIIVSEDWDSAESRILSEEEKIVNQEEYSPIAPENLMVEYNLTYPNEELIPNTNKDSIAHKESVESIDGSNIPALEENGCNISASEENISNVSLPGGNGSSISDSNEITKEILENDAQDDGVQESSVDDQVPILVPGLPPQVEGDGSVSGINESNDHKLPESQNIQKDPEVVAGQEMETKSSYEEIRQEDGTNTTENQSDLQEINNDIVQNDITWGHKTLKKFLSSLRLL
ncbi:hypothetical protein IC575_010337 [Cucumis melo]